MSEHTPLPWHYQEKSDAYTHILRGPKDEYVVGFSQESSGRAEADARFTAKAVNCHGDLLEACNLLIEYITDLNPHKRIGKCLRLAYEAIEKAKQP